MVKKYTEEYGELMVGFGTGSFYPVSKFLLKPYGNTLGTEHNTSVEDIVYLLFVLLFWVFVMLEVRFRVLHVSEKHYITELYPQLQLLLFSNSTVSKTNQSIKVKISFRLLD